MGGCDSICPEYKADPDGRRGYASGIESVGGTRLGEAPIPPLIEISCDPQFDPLRLLRKSLKRYGQIKELNVKGAVLSALRLCHQSHPGDGWGLDHRSL